MAKVEVQYYEVTAKGRVYRYAWKGKGAARLHEEPGTEAFQRELTRHLEARWLGDQTKISGLIALFKASDRWQLPRDKGGFSDSTKKNWSPWLDRIQDHFGKLSVRQFDRPEIRQDIKRWRSKWKASPRTADYGKQVLSAVLSFAVDEGKLATNPCLGIKNLYSVDRSDRIWQAEDLEKLAKKASPEIMFAVRLAALTGLRQADLLKLSWSHVKRLSIEVRTGKSGGKTTAVIPIYKELRELLDQIPRKATTILTNSEALPWRSGFSSSWNKALKAAGMADADLHFHDLRGTAATRMYIAGLKVRAIAEIMAWSEDDVDRLIDRYVRKNELLMEQIRQLDEAAAAKAAKAAGEDED
jgi:integrase